MRYLQTQSSWRTGLCTILSAYLSAALRHPDINNEQELSWERRWVLVCIKGWLKYFIVRRERQQEEYWDCFIPFCFFLSAPQHCFGYLHLYWKAFFFLLTLRYGKATFRPYRKHTVSTHWDIPSLAAMQLSLVFVFWTVSPYAFFHQHIFHLFFIMATVWLLPFSSSSALLHVRDQVQKPAHLPQAL